MTRLVVAEYVKLRTTRAWIGFVLVLLAIAGLAAAGTVGAAPGHELGTTELSRNVLEGALFATLIAFLVGILSVTSEWRHGTVTRTFLVTPRRSRVLVARRSGSCCWPSRSRFWRSPSSLPSPSPGSP